MSETNPIDSVVMRDALALYKPPFSFTCGYIFDSTGAMVADDNCESILLRVRGWGRIQYKDNPGQLQDAVGEHLAKALTEYWERNA